MIPSRVTRLSRLTESVTMLLYRNEGAVHALRSMPERTREMFHLRRFLPPQDYLSPNVIQAMMMIYAMAEVQEKTLSASVGQVAMMTAHLARYRWPVFAVTSELAEALVLTDPPKELLWSDLLWPIEAAAFLVPDTGEMREQFDFPPGKPPMIALGRVKRLPPPQLTTLGQFLGVKPFPPEATDCDVAVALYDDGVNGMVFHDIVTSPEWRLAETCDPEHARKQASPIDLPYVERDFIRMQRLVKWGVNLLGFMSGSYRPDLVAAEGAPARPASVKKGKAKDALFNVRWLGEGYRLKRHPLGGHHASPNAHWRRGHFRNQRVGPGRKATKVLWLEPIFVNPEEKGAP